MRLKLTNMGSHAKLSPSSAARWMACPGSVRMSKDIADKRSFAASEGTVAHNIAEAMLHKPFPWSKLKIGGTVKCEGFEIEQTQEMVDGIKLYVEFIRSLEDIGDSAAYEQRLHLSNIVWGTADALVEVGTTGYVVDFKYGHRPVSPDDNPQLKLYSLMALEEWFEPTVRTVVPVIVQPRSGGIKIGEGLSTNELWAFGKTVGEAASEATAPDAALVAGDHCEWCPARLTCPRLQEHVAETQAHALAPASSMVPAPHEMTIEQISDVLEHSKAIRVFLDDVQAVARERLLGGQEVPGYKVVATAPKRVWAEEVTPEALAERWGPGMLKPVGITDATKVIREVDGLSAAEAKKVLASLVTMVHPAPSLVKASDKRPALNLNPFEPQQIETPKTS